MSLPETYINNTETEKRIWQILETVVDPEVPVLSVIDLGIIRSVAVESGGTLENDTVEITITPTYSGCPAMDAITIDIRLKLLEHGYKNVSIKKILSPAWTTDWMTEAGKEKLKAYGIAPPELAKAATCPRCGSTNTEEVSRFGSTPCKAQWRCKDCLEPFDRFKCH